MYRVIDNTGNCVATFKEYKDVATFLLIKQRPDWRVLSYNKKVTPRQKGAINFIENMLDITFEGDINNYQQVSNFIGLYLDEAKIRYYDILECSDIVYKDYYE